MMERAPLEISFGDELWDSFDTVAQRTRDGVDFAKDEVVPFLKKLGTIEEQYSKALLKLINPSSLLDKMFDKDAPESIQNGTFWRSWTTFKQQIGAIAKSHGEFGDHILNTTAETCIGEVTEMEKNLREALDEAKKFEKVSQSSLNHLAKAKENYVKTSRKMVDAQSGYNQLVQEGAEESKLQKGITKYNQWQQKLDEAEAAYRDSVNEVNSAQEQYHKQDMKGVLDSLQEVEAQRIDMVQYYLRDTASAFLQCLASDQEFSCLMVKAAEMTDRNKDMLHFVKDNRSGKRQPDPILFFSYDLIEQGKERDVLAALTIQHWWRALRERRRALVRARLMHRTSVREKRNSSADLSVEDSDRLLESLSIENVLASAVTQAREGFDSVEFEEHMGAFHDLCIQVKLELAKQGRNPKNITVQELYDEATIRQLEPEEWDEFIRAQLLQKQRSKGSRASSLLGKMADKTKAFAGKAKATLVEMKNELVADDPNAPSLKRMSMKKSFSEKRLSLRVQEPMYPDKEYEEEPIQQEWDDVNQYPDGEEESPVNGGRS